MATNGVSGQGGSGHLRKINGIDTRLAAVEAVTAVNVPNRVDVSRVEDLPAPVGDEITLDPDTHYFVHGRIIITPNVLVGSNVRIIGDGSELTAIETVSSKPLIKTDGTGIRVLLNSIDLQNFGSGGILDCDLALTNGTLLIFTCNFTSLGPGVIIRNAVFVEISTMFLIAQQGLQVINDARALSIAHSSFFSIAAAPQYYAIRVESTAILEAFTVTSCSISLNDASDFGLSLDPGATYPQPVRVNTCAFLAPGTSVDPAGLSKKDASLIVLNSPGVEDSIFAAQASFNGNAVAMTLPVQGTKYKIGNGAPAHELYVLGADSERFSLNAGTETQNQALVTDSTEPHPYLIRATISLTKSGPSNDIQGCLYVDGVEMTNSCTTIEVNANGSRQLISENFKTLLPTDELDMRISNESGTDGVTVLSASLTAQRL
jgi:hypothetical protein